MALILALARSLGAHPTFDKSIAVAPPFSVPFRRPFLPLRSLSPHSVLKQCCSDPQTKRGKKASLDQKEVLSLVTHPLSILHQISF